MFRSIINAVLLGFCLTVCDQAVAADASKQDRAVRIEAFEAIAVQAVAAPPVSDSAMHCSEDRRWCARIHSDAQTGTVLLEVLDLAVPGKERVTSRYELPQGEGDEPPTLWPHIVRVPLVHSSRREQHSAMMGVVMHRWDGYSGGGASASHLVLIKVDAGSGRQAMFAEMLSVPLSGSSIIRACFSEADVEQRAGACHDQYGFSASLALHEAKVSAGLPEFSYETEATSFPGPVSRSADSLANPPLKEEDLVTVVNEECSYRRILRFDPAIGRYEFDTPAPDCSDFTEP